MGPKDHERCKILVSSLDRSVCYLSGFATYAESLLPASIVVNLPSLLKVR